MDQDVIIVGGGVGGLVAASYLGRFHRPTLVIDAGASRARWIPTSHNIPGFPSGVEGTTFLQRLRAQSEQYGASFRTASVEAIGQAENGFVLTAKDMTMSTRFLIVATGVQDYLPSLPDAEEVVIRSVLRVCPICDGYEATGKRIAVIGKNEHAEQEARFLRTYSKRVAYVHLGNSVDLDRVTRMAREGIELIEASLEALSFESELLRVRLSDGEVRTFDVAYTALGCHPRVDLVTPLGAKYDENNALLVNRHQMTSIDGLYAAGDMVRGLNQVVVAAAEAAVAATDVHNRLRALGR